MFNVNLARNELLLARLVYVMFNVNLLARSELPLAKIGMYLNNRPVIFSNLSTNKYK